MVGYIVFSIHSIGILQKGCIDVHLYRRLTNVFLVSKMKNEIRMNKRKTNLCYSKSMTEKVVFSFKMNLGMIAL